jgi:hypothetical protein
MVIDMNETRLWTIEQVEQFINASTLIAFSAIGHGRESYEHISGVLEPLDYRDHTEL